MSNGNAVREREKIISITPKEMHEEREAPRVSTQINLQPVAAPMILGLYGLATGTFLVGTLWARWYGGDQSMGLLLPFVALMGGLAQLLAGMWAYRARDVLATAIHGVWGAFWLAFGAFSWLSATSVIAVPATAVVPELGIAFVVMAAITLSFTVASLARSGTLFVSLALLTISTALAAISYFAGSLAFLRVAGWFMLVSGVIAYYVGSAMVLNKSFGRHVLPIGYVRMARMEHAVDNGYGEPGVTLYE